MNQMTLDEVKRIAASGDYRRVPVTREILADIRTPVETLRALQKVSGHCFLLESVEDSRQWGRYTFLGYDPSMEISCKDHLLTVISGRGEKKQMQTDHPGIFIKQVIKENRSPRLKDLPTLTGGLVGYFSYEYIQYGEPALKLDAPDEDRFDDVNLMLFDKLICYDNFRQKIILIVNAYTDHLDESYSRAVMALDEMEEIIRHGEPKKNERGRLLE